MTTREWAMKMIPVLVYWARESWEIPHTYKDLCLAVGYRSYRIGGMLGRIHDILSSLEEEWNTHGSLEEKRNTPIPTLNSLVVGKDSGLPKSGFSYVKHNYDNRKIDKAQEEASECRRRAHEYDWSLVLKALGIEPYQPPMQVEGTGD